MRHGQVTVRAVRAEQPLYDGTVEVTVNDGVRATVSAVAFKERAIASARVTAANGEVRALSPVRLSALTEASPFEDSGEPQEVRVALAEGWAELWRRYAETIV